MTRLRARPSADRPVLAARRAGWLRCAWSVLVDRLEKALQIYKILNESSFKINEDKLPDELCDFPDLVQE